MSQETTQTRRVGALDCGTNSIRLLIADIEYRPSDGKIVSLTDLVRTMRIVRLGAGVDATGWLSQEALSRTFAAAEEYAEQLKEHGVEYLRMAATSATRDAGNRQEFVDGIHTRLGVDPEVISGVEEARLSFTGALSSLDDPGAGRNLVVDLGGGSTEFVLGDSNGVIAAKSVDIGCVRLTERYISSNPPTESQIQRLIGDVDAAVTTAMAEVPLGTATRLIGVAGSVTTVTAHALGLDRYDPQRIDGTVLENDVAIRAAHSLSAMTRTERAALGFMHEGRVDVIGAGAEIWARIIERVNEATDGRVTSVTTSEHDILDGLAISLMPRPETTT